MTPLFSVIIPVFNRADVLEQAVRSVLTQTCQDFEIVVVDDGSSDHPDNTITKIADPRIRIVRKENGGGASARNRGFDEARGRFVALLDSDDHFLPHHLENMRRLLENTQNTVGYARMVVDRGNGVTLLKPPRAIRPGEHMASYLLCDRGFVPTITVALPTEIARKVRYGESWRAAEDTDFAIRLFLAGCVFRMVEEPGAVWDDTYNPNRTSAGRKGARLLPWIEEMKPHIPARAYYGARGWAIAKGVVVDRPWTALRYYLTAVLRRLLRPAPRRRHLPADFSSRLALPARCRRRHSFRPAPRRIGLMLTRRLFLEQLAGATATLRPSLAAVQDQGLRDLAARRGIVYGCAAATYELKDVAFAAALAREAGILSAEYEMKRAALEPTRGAYDFSGGDGLLAFARQHGMAFRGHTLVWHHSNPPWLESALQSQNAEALLTGYIASVVGHYKGQVRSWDVVNEVIQPSDGRSDGLRNTMWLKRFGPGYIDTAFHAARQADPGAMLVYNDWGCEWGAPENDRFRAATLEFLSNALARGVPIQALGMQGHLSAFGTQVDQRKLAAFLNSIRQMGLKILVTEHDVDDSGGSSDIAIRDRAVADASRRFLEVMLDSPATTAVLTWGLSDRFLDQPGWRDQMAGRFPRMLPLDKDFRRKPMWDAMAKAFA